MKKKLYPANRVKVSIIIPLYNTKDYLEKCLDSVTTQALKQVEIICIDDGSMDGSWEIIRRFADRDNRIVALRQENSGPSKARNKGIEIARGEYIGFVDSDDYVDTNYFKSLYETAIKNKADIARAYVKVEYENHDKNSKQAALNEEDYFNNVLKEKILKNKLNQKHVSWLAIYKKSLLDEHNIRFRHDLKAGEDALFCIETSYYANKIVYVENIGIFYHYRKNREGSLMTDFVNTEKGLLTRAQVVFATVDMLNKFKDYDKEIYIDRVVQTIRFIDDRLHFLKSNGTATKLSQILASSWGAIKYKEDIEKALSRAGISYTVALDDPRKLRIFIIAKMSRDATQTNKELISKTKNELKVVVSRNFTSFFKKLRFLLKR